MSVKITLEFNGVDEAIVALGKLVAAPVKAAKNPEAPEKTRPVSAEGTAIAAQPTSAPVAEGPVVKKARKARADKGQTREPYKAREQEANGAGASAPAETAPAIPATTAASTAAPQAAPAPAASPVTDAQVMAAVEKIYGAKGYDDTAAVLARFGAKKWAQLLPEQRGEFIAKIDRVLAGEAI